MSSDFKKTHDLATALKGCAAAPDRDGALLKQLLLQAAETLEMYVDREELLSPIFAYCAELSRSVPPSVAERFFNANFHDGQVGDMLRDLSDAFEWNSRQTPESVHKDYESLFSQIAIWYDQWRQKA